MNGLLAPTATKINGQPWFRDGYMLVPYRPPQAHEQRMTFIQPVRVATCEEVLCNWYLLGAEGMDEGRSFKHPKGARCGDSRGCLPCMRPVVNVHGRKGPCGDCPPCKAGTGNCPCSGRLPHRLPNTVEFEDRVIDPVARAKYRPQPVRHRRNVLQNGQVVSRDVTGDEFKQRIAEGLDARNHINTRGI